jgi:hypothetical protein
MGAKACGDAAHGAAIRQAADLFGGERDVMGYSRFRPLRVIVPLRRVIAAGLPGRRHERQARADPPQSPCREEVR